MKFTYLILLKTQFLIKFFFLKNHRLKQKNNFPLKF